MVESVAALEWLEGMTCLVRVHSLLPRAAVVSSVHALAHVVLVAEPPPRVRLGTLDAARLVLLHDRGACSGAERHELLVVVARRPIRGIVETRDVTLAPVVLLHLRPATRQTMRHHALHAVPIVRRHMRA